MWKKTSSLRTEVRRHRHGQNSAAEGTLNFPTAQLFLSLSLLALVSAASFYSSSDLSSSSSSSSSSPSSSSSSSGSYFSTDKATRIVKPFYDALQAGTNVAENVLKSVSDDWVSCGEEKKKMFFLSGFSSSAGVRSVPLTNDEQAAMKRSRA